MSKTDYFEYLLRRVSAMPALPNQSAKPPALVGCACTKSYQTRTRPVFTLTAGDNPQRVVRQWLPQFEGLGRIRREPKVDLCRRRQDHRHRLGMDRRDDGVGLRR